MITIALQIGILSIWMSEVPIWRANMINEIWLILNYSKVVWDIDTKFSPVVVLISFQLSTKFEGHNSLKKTAMPLGSSKWKWAWRAHFLSHTYETQKICCFLEDVQIILVSLFEFFDYTKVEKNAGAFLSRCSELLDWANRQASFHRLFDLMAFLSRETLGLFRFWVFSLMSDKFYHTADFIERPGPGCLHISYF